MRRRGFTLAEMMVVIAVGTIVFALAAQAMIQTVRSSNREMSRMTRSMSARLVMERMARDIESSFAVRAPQATELLFSGTDNKLGDLSADRLTLTRPRLGAGVPNELERVTYEVKERTTREQGSHQVIALQRDILNANGELTVEGNPTILGLPEATADFELELQYLTSRSGAPDWRSSWQRETRLPAAVKIHLSVHDSKSENPIQLETIAWIHSASLAGGTP